MADIPNARRYRTTGNQNSSGNARRAGWQEQYDSNAYHHAGTRATEANQAERSGSVGGLIALLVFAALLIAFPIPVLVICLIAFAAKLFFGTK